MTAVHCGMRCRVCIAGTTFVLVLHISECSQSSVSQGSCVMAMGRITVRQVCCLLCACLGSVHHVVQRLAKSKIKFCLAPHARPLKGSVDDGKRSVALDVRYPKNEV